jgi:hypothetical protein
MNSTRVRISRHDAIVTVIGLLPLLLGTATGNAFVMLVMSVVALLVLALLFRNTLRQTMVVAITAAATIASSVAFLISKVPAMRQFINHLGLLVVLLVFVGRAVLANGEPVSVEKIPKAVKEALLSKFPKAKIDKCTKEKEGDDVVYDIEFKQEDRKYEADIKENGDYINYEKAIEIKDLPKLVQDSIDKRYPKSTLNEVMEETEVTGKEEKLVAYEVVLITADKKDVELKVAPDGTILEDSGAEKPKAEK